MVIGVARITIVVPEAATLKDKRRVRDSLTTRVRAKFNVSVAEVDTQDSRETITIALACVSTDSGHAHEMLEKAIRYIESARMDGYVADYGIEMW
jgi:uncharacterized protein YlxP (DUF503 family)